MDASDIFDKEYSSDNRLIYTLTNAGTYKVTVYAKDLLLAKPYDAVKSLNVNVYNPAIITVNVTGTCLDLFK